MDTIIERLDGWIKTNRPIYYKDLNKGLSNNEIKQWQDKFGFKFPKEFKCLYQWRNGQLSSNDNDFFFDFHLFDNIEKVYDAWCFGNKDLVEYNNEDIIFWGPSWLKCFSTWTNNGFCLDVNGDLGILGGMVNFIQDGESNVHYPNLKIMLEIVVSQFEQGVYGNNKKDFENGFELIDYEKANQIYNEIISA